jgi:hypothetical protein
VGFGIFSDRFHVRMIVEIAQAVAQEMRQQARILPQNAVQQAMTRERAEAFVRIADREDEPGQNQGSRFDVVAKDKPRRLAEIPLID